MFGNGYFHKTGAQRRFKCSFTVGEKMYMRQKIVPNYGLNKLKRSLSYQTRCYPHREGET